MFIKTALNRHKILNLLVLIAALMIFGSTLISGQQNNVRFLQTKIQNSSRNVLIMGTDNITLKFEGQELGLNGPVVYKENRYYLPLIKLISEMGGSVKREGQYININFMNQDILINVPEQRFSKNNIDFSVALKPEGKDYLINLSDLCQMLNLVTDWNVEERVLGLYVNRELQVHAPLTTIAPGKTALIRLEDVTSGGPYYTSEALAKLRAIADYLYAENIPFHVAWVPRYIDPANFIDRSIADQYSMLNTDFVFTLDYIVSRGGIIGLHGYTHQYGDTVTLKGTEFRSIYEKSGIPDTDSYIQERLTNAIQAANKLNIPYGFFEAPHYVLSPNAERLAEHYFDFIYQSYPGDPSNPDKVVRKGNFNRYITYVPTPLGYIHGEDDLSRVFNQIKQKGPKPLASFYFHPFLEFRNISITRDDTGYPQMLYSQDSILHKLVKEFKRQGYTFISIYQLGEN